LEKTQNLFADTVVIKVRSHILNNIVDYGTIDGRLATDDMNNEKFKQLLLFTTILFDMILP